MLIDRPPKYFAYVLDYLRLGGKLPPNLPKDPAELERVRVEFDYFLLTHAFPSKPLVKAINEGSALAIHVLKSCLPSNRREQLHAALLNERFVWAVWFGGGKFSVEAWDLDSAETRSAAAVVPRCDFTRVCGGRPVTASCQNSFALTSNRWAACVYNYGEAGITLEHELRETPVWSLALSKEQVAMLSAYHHILVYSRESGKKAYELGHGATSALAMHDNTLYYSPSDCLVAAVDLGSGEAPRGRYRGHGEVLSVGVVAGG